MITIFFTILLKIIKDILYFPVWWYSIGFFELLIFLSNFLKERSNSTAILVWIKNIFVPMYGQRDFWSRVISFSIRFVQIIYRSILMLFWIFISMLLLCFWIFIPILILFNIFKIMFI